MSIPGFSGEVSAYRTTSHYPTPVHSPATPLHVLPMGGGGGKGGEEPGTDGGAGSSCGSCHCTGGQCCKTTLFGGCECYACPTTLTELETLPVYLKG